MYNILICRFISENNPSNNIKSEELSFFKHQLKALKPRKNRSVRNSWICSNYLQSNPSVDPISSCLLFCLNNIISQKALLTASLMFCLLESFQFYFLKNTTLLSQQSTFAASLNLLLKTDFYVCRNTPTPLMGRLAHL